MQFTQVMLGDDARARIAFVRNHAKRPHD